MIEFVLQEIALQEMNLTKTSGYHILLKIVQVYMFTFSLPIWKIGTKEGVRLF